MIELLVVMSLMVLLSGAGLFMSMKNNQKQVVDQAAEKLRSVILQARSNSLSGINQCGTDIFLGWRVVVVSNGYTVEGVCENSEFSSKTETYPSSISFSPATILFGPQGVGTEPITINVGTKTVSVSVTGNVTIN